MWIFHGIYCTWKQSYVQCRMQNFQIPTHSSNELSDLHTTQTWASGVHASVVTELPPTYLHKQTPRGHQRGNWTKEISKSKNIYKPHSSFKPTWNFWRVCLCPSNYIFDINKKNQCWHWGTTAEVIPHSQPTASQQTVQNTPGPSVHHILMGVYHTGVFHATSSWSSLFVSHKPVILGYHSIIIIPFVDLPCSNHMAI